MKRFISESQVDLTPLKRMVNDEIFRKHYDGEQRSIPFGDLPPNLKPTDLIVYQSDPGHYSDNNSWGPFTEVVIIRPRPETDTERSERLEESRRFMEELRQRRFDHYLRLKKEFGDIDEK